MRRIGMRHGILRATVVIVGALMALPAGLLVAPAVAGTGTAFLAGHTVHPLRSPDGAPVRGPYHTVETSNWSGYAVANYQTGLTYTAATGTWVVPTVTAPSGGSYYSASWVGIGGFCENARCRKVDSTLIQLGTEQDATASGATSYSAWYELLPAAPVTIPLTIKPGDTVTATLSDGPSAAGTTKSGKGGGGGNHGGGGGNHGGGGSASQSWTLTMTDGSQSWSKTVSYASSLLSAEWIQEAPAACFGGFCSILPLADFGTVTFDPGTVNGGNPGLTASQGILMADPNGQTSNVSAPDSDSDGFNACWGSGSSFASCSPPSG